jgi:hypothetical protein
MNALHSHKNAEANKYIPAEIDTLSLKLDAVCQLLHEAGGISAVDRCGTGVKTGIYYLITDLVAELRREIEAVSEFDFTDGKGDAA